MNQTNRTILFIIITFLIIVGWDTWQLKMHPPKHHPASTPAAGQAPSSAPAGPSGSTPATPPAAPAAPASRAPVAEAPDEPPGPPVRIETSLWTAEFSPRGAALSSFVLKGRKEEARARPGTPRTGVDLATPGVGQPLPLSTEIDGLPPAADFGVDATYRVSVHTDSPVPGPIGAGNELVFERRRAGVKVTKVYTWKPDSYALHLTIEVQGAPAGTLPVKTYYTAFQAPQERHWYDLGPRPEVYQSICYIAGERTPERRALSDTKPLQQVQGSPAFAGMDEVFFLAAMIPGADPAPSSCSIGAPGGSAAMPGEQVAILNRSVTVAGGAPATTSLDLFMGPKKTDALAQADHDLDKSVNLGFFGIIGRFLILPILKFFHALVSNWGVAIILLTLLVKLLTLPLTHHQMKSMNEGRRLAPEVEKIKQKYAGDMQRINTETMKMYKEHGYQPLAGCVPTLIQMPIWYALYRVLEVSFELYNEPFIPRWINDLTYIDPYYITPALMTVTMALTQVLTPQAQAPSPEMKYVMYLMPVMFGWFMLSLPSGLVLYIFTNNLLSIAQSIWFRRKFPVPPPTAPPAATKAARRAAREAA